MLRSYRTACRCERAFLRRFALAAFDDFEWADLLAPRLTTVAQPSRELGVTAARMLFARLAAPDRPPRTVHLRPTLQIRNSCGCVTPLLSS